MALRNKNKTSYEGCHPDIARKLQKGEHVECIVWDESGALDAEDTIVAYVQHAPRPYRSEISSWKMAEPAPEKEVRVKHLVPLMKQISARGWVQRNDGAWIHPSGYVTAATIFFECGKVPKTPESYHPWMLEEVEVDV